MVETKGLHEDFSRADTPKSGSERSFGIVFAAVFAGIGLWPMWDGGLPHVWAGVTATGFLAAGFFAPKLLAPLNRAWYLFGLGLHKVVNPLIMGLLFFLTVTPIALIMRAVGKDPLNRRFEPDTESYWIERTPPGPKAETMRQQF
ncbi:MAG: hypothetical protein HN377_02280 [Alphaproteobacteria bacterium]|jgi:hypothetical protein|nr:hypothetical protein [Alphaproteobacteria bacterium]MBT7944104.1 hypothetical protein [Alphaproteobacteria bacterium]